MAGNPYTESGEKFQIPDMLANRADTYNLGEILTGKDDLFALSYLENALTSNPVLAPLAARDPADLAALLRMAEGEPCPQRAVHVLGGRASRDRGGARGWLQGAATLLLR
jgi:hypothetical protein